MSSPESVSFDTEQIEVVSFDLWKTLIETGQNPNKNARAKALYGMMQPDVELEEFIATSRRLEKRADKLAEDTERHYGPRERVQMLADHYGAPMLGDDALEAFYTSEAQRFFGNPPVLITPNTPERLKLLAATKELAIVSNTGFMNGREMRVALDTLGINEHFTYHIFSDEVGHNKPHPKIYQALLALSGVEPCRVLHIGDNYSADVAGAQNMGMRAAHVSAEISAMDIINPLIESEEL